MTVFIMTGITRRQAKHIQNGLVRIKEAYNKLILHGAATLLTPPPNLWALSPTWANPPTLA